MNPVVSNTVPAPDATGVLPSAVVTATFSKDMKEAETEAAFTLVKDSDSSVVPGTAHYDTLGTRRLTFTPSSPLIPGEKYTATVAGDGSSSGAEATDDVYLFSNKIWSFWVSSRPAVLLSTPANGSVGVSRTSSVKVVFSKSVRPVTTWASAIIVQDSGGTPVPGTVSYEPTTFTVTFDPTSDFLFAVYDVTVSAAGIESDPEGIPMAADVDWSFTTVPSLTEPVAANNKIVPGGAQKVTIFIPQPTSNPADKVTVQVFTTTGRRVATLVNNQSYASIAASLPLLWDGTNGKAQRLGPGLYFIRITAPGYSRVLKVMIVR